MGSTDLAELALMIPPLALFVMAMVGSPGPANIALMGVGATAGVRGALPFFTGVLTGFVLLALVLAFGLSELLTRYPILAQALTLIGTGYLGWLAYKLWTARPAVTAEKTEVPGFLEGLPVHPLNPKAWAMLVAALSRFVEPGPDATAQAILVIAGFVVFGAPLNMVWCAGGAMISRLLADRRRAVRLNRSLAVLLMVSLGWSLLR
ncbi:MAG: LysE family translocator [Alphaproteobacteria bacterium]|nr:LysE family translocator [Alphaproteobacteria bacterium]